MIKCELDCIEGNKVRLRLVRAEDATYIHALRMDPRYNAHLSAVSGTIDVQRAWIEDYKSREAAGTEYYYVIERRADDRACGVVRLYDFSDDHFTWGSWILDENKPKLAALESAFLIYCIGFEILGCKRSVFDVRIQNERTLAFHRRFGAMQTGMDDLNIYFQYTSDRFLVDRRKHLEFLNISEVS